MVFQERTKERGSCFQHQWKFNSVQWILTSSKKCWLEFKLLGWIFDVLYFSTLIPGSSMIIEFCSPIDCTCSNLSCTYLAPCGKSPGKTLLNIHTPSIWHSPDSYLHTWIKHISVLIYADLLTNRRQKMVIIYFWQYQGSLKQADTRVKRGFAYP